MRLFVVRISHVCLHSFFLPGLCGGSSCNFPARAKESVQPGISPFLLWDRLFFSVFIVLCIRGNDVIFLIIYSRAIYVLLTFCCMQKPRAWNMQAVQVWFQSVIVTKDFIYSVYCLTFVSSHLCLKCQSDCCT